MHTGDSEIAPPCYCPSVSVTMTRKSAHIAFFCQRLFLLQSFTIYPHRYSMDHFPVHHAFEHFSFKLI
jgi:hypothetical protein